jgi:hypothetical protein
VCTLAAKKKNQDRFRHVGSDHSLVSPLGTSATNYPPVSAPDDDECEPVGGIIIGGGNRSN